VTIPVENVYYLLLYAWRRIGHGPQIEVRDRGFVHLHDLFAHVLAETASRLLSRGLDRQYLEVDDVIGGIRGKLDLTATLQRNHLANARAHCRFDELHYDVLHNRILKATLRSLLGLDLDAEIRTRVRRLHQKLDAVADVRIERRDFGRVQIHRNNRAYDFALRLCRLIHDNLMIEEGAARASFRDLRRDDRQMAALFEEFVFNFFDIEQRVYRVSRPHIAWHEASGTVADLEMLPTMRTDVVLESPHRCVILDTKYYAEALAGRFEGKKLRSGHLYQIFAYIENRAARDGAVAHEGMLLYPVVDDAFAFDYRLKGHRVTIRSIDLNQPWEGIRGDLLRLVM
jgi:5-methylcytosine-specific restriction enzyme subunit McrC